MAKEYYLGIDNQQLGPFHKDELLLNGMTEETLVWTEGMSDWLPASDVAELASLFSGTIPPPATTDEISDFGNFDVSSRFGPPSATGQTSLGASATNPLQLDPSSFLGWNIAVTVISPMACIFGIAPMITGIIGINKSAKVNRALRVGDREAAEVNSRTAKTMFIVSLGLWIIGFILMIIVGNIPDEKTKSASSASSAKIEQSAVHSSADIVVSDFVSDTAAGDDASEEE